MIRGAFLSIVRASLFAACGYAQGPASSPAASVWNALSSPAMDPAKSARTDNVEIVRDRVHITPSRGHHSICPAGQWRDFRSRISWERESPGRAAEPHRSAATEAVREARQAGHVVHRCHLQFYG